MTSPQKQNLAGLLSGLALAALLFVGGCQSSGLQRREIVTNTDPAPTLGEIENKDAVVGDAATKIATANKANTDPTSRFAIDVEVKRILDVLRLSSWTKTKETIERLVTERNAAQAHAAKLQDRIDQLERDLTAAKDDANRQAYLGVVRTFAAVGAVISAIGVGLLLWSTYKRAGWLVLAAGPLVGGSGLLWGKPWFYIPLGVGALCLIFAAIIKTIWIVLDADKNGKIDLLERKGAGA